VCVVRARVARIDSRIVTHTCKASQYVRLTSQSLRRWRHSTCAILHLAPCRTPMPLFLSVDLPLPRSPAARASQHVPRGSAHLL